MTKTQKANTWRTISLIVIIILVIGLGITIFLLNVAKNAYKAKANEVNQLKVTNQYDNSRNKTRIDSAVYVTNKGVTKKSVKQIDNTVANDTIILNNSTSPDVAVELWTEWMEPYLKPIVVQTNNSSN